MKEARKDVLFVIMNFDANNVEMKRGLYNHPALVASIVAIFAKEGKATTFLSGLTRTTLKEIQLGCGPNLFEHPDFETTFEVTNFKEQYGEDKHRNLNDKRKEAYKTIAPLLNLFNLQNDSGSMLATTTDPVMDFMAGPDRDIAKSALRLRTGKR